MTPVKGTWVRRSSLYLGGTDADFLPRSMKYNFILETGSPGGLWVSTGSSPLTKVFTGSLNGNGGTDWHIGEQIP